MAQQVKDLALSVLWLWLQLCHGFDPWPRSVGQGSIVAVICGGGHRCGSDLVLLWLWCRLAAAAPILPLAWVLP